MTTLRNIIELNKYQKNKPSDLKWDNGGFQYIWGSPPNCTEPGTCDGTAQTLHYIQPGWNTGLI